MGQERMPSNCSAWTRSSRSAASHLERHGPGTREVEHDLPAAEGTVAHVVHTDLGERERREQFPRVWVRPLSNTKSRRSVNTIGRYRRHDWRMPTRTLSRRFTRPGNFGTAANGRTASYSSSSSASPIQR